MNEPVSDVGSGTAMTRSARAGLVLVLGVAALDWAGWATGIERLTRLHPSWPSMTPWTALLLASLATAILAQWGLPSVRRVNAARVLAAVVAAVAVLILLEFATGSSFGLDTVWFGDAVEKMQSTWPGRPSPQTAWSFLFVAAGVALIRVDRGVIDVVWPTLLVAGAVVPSISVAGYMFNALDLVSVTPSTGQAITTAVALLLLIGSLSAARPDRHPLAWLLARRDRQALIRLMGVLGGFPIVVALSRLSFLRLGVGDRAAWVIAIAVGTVVVGAVTFYLSQREHQLLVLKESLNKERDDAEQRYRLLADNAVDIVVHLRGRESAWVSPSVEAAFGGTLQNWIGLQFSRRIHADDAEKLATALERVESGESVRHRFRICADDGEYHWVDGHGKPYVDADGRIDGVIAALRVVDDQVAAEQRLDRLARFDTLTGLANRAEAIARLELELEHPSGEGTHLGILYCDVDGFKGVNDTWGHGVGDTVLSTLAARIVECVRPEDTVGRTGGDEILVLLPAIHSIDEAASIAEKIRRRAAEPMYETQGTIMVTLSIGVTVAVPGEHVSVITARADAAMYQAKLNAKNAVIRIEPAL